SVDGLEQVIRGAKLVTQALLVDDREQDYGNVARREVPLESVQDLPAVRLEHYDVEGNCAGPEIPRFLESLLARLCALDSVACVAKVLAQEVNHIRVIVDRQHKLPSVAVQGLWHGRGAIRSGGVAVRLRRRQSAQDAAKTDGQNHGKRGAGAQP